MKPFPVHEQAPPQDAVLEYLTKILSSELFRGSERSTNLLRYLVQQTLDGQSGLLKEYTIGVEALGKSPTFDPRTDPIVRAEIARLRTRLDKYYATEGGADPLIIVLPKGRYVPKFQPRPAEADNTEPPAAEPLRLKTSFWFASGIAAACVFAMVAFGLWRVAQPYSAVSIAVLPFANVSADAAQEFFSDGMTDEIAEALAKVPNLRIVARSSAYTFKNKNQQAREVGQALNATHLIVGAVRQVGQRVRISAQLIEARNGLQLWSRATTAT